MAETQPPAVQKKTYIKPQITEVRLVAQEAVLGLCRNGDSEACSSDLNCLSSPGT